MLWPSVATAQPGLENADLPRREPLMRE